MREYGMGQSIFPDSLDRFAVGRTHPDELTDAINQIERDLREHWGHNGRHYGAKGDNVQDDAPRIQAAIDAAEAAGGGVVRLPEGSYRLLTTLTMRPQVILQGAGIGATVLLPAAGVDAITFPSSPANIHDWQIRDLQVDGGRHGLVQQGEAADGLLSQVQFGGLSGNGLVTDGFERVTLDQVRLINIDGYGWLGCQQAASTFARVHAVTVTQLYCAQIGEDAIYWPNAPSNEPSGFGSRISNLKCFDIGKRAFRAEHLQDLLIEGGALEWCSAAADNTYDAISLEPVSGAVIVGVTVKGVKISTGSGPVGQRYGVRITGHFCTVEGCSADARTKGFSLYTGTAHSADGVWAVNNNGTYDTTAGYTGCRRLFGDKDWDPPSVAAGAQTTTTVTVTGAVEGDPVTVGFRDLQGLQLTGYVSGADTVTAVLQNGTAGAVDLLGGRLRAIVERY